MSLKKSAAKLVNGLTVGSLISAYAAQASIAKVLVRDEKKRRRIFIENISRYSHLSLKQMNISVETIGHDPKKFKNKNYLFISNHMSYLDILCLSSIHPAMFITSVDMGEAFFLGRMAELGGSLFVERRNRSKIERDIESIATALREGFDVVLYPEGTSSSGEKVLPFKKSLLMAAVKAQVDILPVVIKYAEINGERFSEKNRDKVCWYGDMDFGPHFLGVLGLESVKVVIEFLDPIKVSPEADRQELASQAFSQISECYNKLFT